MNSRNPALFSLIILGLLCIHLQTTAQTRSSKKVDKYENKYPNLENTLWLQVNPLTLAEPESALALTVSYKTGKFISVGLEGGVFVAYNEYFDSLSTSSYRGYRLKPEVKFYPNGERKGPRNFYISLRGLIKQSTRPREEWLTSSNSSGQGSFTRLVNYDEKKWVLGFGGVAGSEFIMGPRKRFMIDIFGGVGLRYKKFHTAGLPPGFTVSFNSNDDRFFFQDGVLPYLTLGFKLGYRIL